MKIYALAALLIFCFFENATARWQDDVKINHMQQINTIINRQLQNIRSTADSKGTVAAQQCAERARLELRSISYKGYSDVSSCVFSASTQGIANVCAVQVDSRVFNEALEVAKTANECIKKA